MSPVPQQHRLREWFKTGFLGAFWLAGLAVAWIAASRTLSEKLALTAMWTQYAVFMFGRRLEEQTQAL